MRHLKKTDCILPGDMRYSDVRQRTPRRAWRESLNFSSSLSKANDERRSADPLLEIPLSIEGRGTNARCFGYSRRQFRPLRVRTRKDNSAGMEQVLTTPRV
jgi:hypothetical protein